MQRIIPAKRWMICRKPRNFANIIWIYKKPASPVSGELLATCSACRLFVLPDPIGMGVSVPSWNRKIRCFSVLRCPADPLAIRFCTPSAISLVHNLVPAFAISFFRSSYRACSASARRLHACLLKEHVPNIHHSVQQNVSWIIIRNCMWTWRYPSFIHCLFLPVSNHHHCIFLTFNTEKLTASSTSLFRIRMFLSCPCWMKDVKSPTILSWDTRLYRLVEME